MPVPPTDEQGPPTRADILRAITEKPDPANDAILTAISNLTAAVVNVQGQLTALALAMAEAGLLQPGIADAILTAARTD